MVPIITSICIRLWKIFSNSSYRTHRKILKCRILKVKMNTSNVARHPSLPGAEVPYLFDMPYADNNSSRVGSEPRSTWRPICILILAEICHGEIKWG